MRDTIYRDDAIRVASGYCHPANVAKELEKLPSAEPHWIPCSERLPEVGEVVLVWVERKWLDWKEDRHIEFGRISSKRDDVDGKGWEWLNESGADYWECCYTDEIVKAWMALPEPYMGGAE